MSGIQAPSILLLRHPQSGVLVHVVNITTQIQSSFQKGEKKREGPHSPLFYFYFILFFNFFGVDFFFTFLFIYLFMAVLGLRFCARAFSSCGEWGPLFIAVRELLTIVASLVAEHRLQTRRLSSCGSRA